MMMMMKHFTDFVRITEPKKFNRIEVVLNYINSHNRKAKVNRVNSQLPFSRMLQTFETEQSRNKLQTRNSRACAEYNSRSMNVMKSCLASETG